MESTKQVGKLGHFEEKFTVGQFIRFWRNLKGLRQQHVEEQAGLSRGQLCNYEMDRTTLSAARLIKLMRVVGVPYEMLSEVSDKQAKLNLNRGKKKRTDKYWICMRCARAKEWAGPHGCVTARVGLCGHCNRNDEVSLIPVMDFDRPGQPAWFD